MVFFTVLLKLLYPHYLLNTFYSLTPVLDPAAGPTFFSWVLFAHFALFGLAALAVIRKRSIRSLGICFLLTAFLQDMASSGRWGSNLYYFLPTLAAAAIVAASELSVLLKRIEEFPVPTRILAGLTIVWLGTCALWLGAQSSQALGIHRLLHQREITFPERPSPWAPEALKILASANGPVLTTVPDLVLLNASPRIEGLNWACCVT